ncbi:flavin monoamine oxidase family protein [Microterricola viridarii]|uniref:NAD(P)-binding Rossmann-like domain-containing protein n=1 Tax=Microterricola viridarii TaxID=412690 RepID=A0A1H1LAB7_9MICO|nr:FAD-dependent oxidoreductase [Microterricola viridarii]SDR71300.1 NAD(P)-binding Rossmann-like domain-containing protein [Microterricola viridarii]
MKRRDFLIGSASAITLLALTACTPAPPSPTPTPTRTPAPPLPTGVPQPIRLQRSNWGTDPFARGAFSYPRVDSTDELRVQLRRSLDDRLFFAGEATASDSPGTVQGAQGSGVRAALDISDVAERGERIAVIGAGIAGLTAARALRESGFDVVVVEARDRLGGRIQSMVDDHWPVPVELGPLFLSDSSSMLAGQLALAGVGTQPFARTPEVRTGAGTVVGPSDVGSKALASAGEWATGHEPDSSVAEALTESGVAASLGIEPDANGVAPIDWLGHELTSVLQPAAGASADLVSAQQLDPLLARAASMTEIVTGSAQGLGGLISSLADGLDVLVGSPVATIMWDDTGVSLRLAHGESLRTDRVLVTIPLGVLQQDTTLFEPALPSWKLDAIGELGMGTVDTVWLQFDEAFWATDATVLSTIGPAVASEDGTTPPTAASDEPSGALPDATPVPAPERSPIAYWTNLAPLTGSPVLVGTIAAEFAAELGALSDEEFSARVLAALAPFAPGAGAP